MNILFLDDNMYRTRTARSLMPSLTAAGTAEECIRLLPICDWSIVWLDHDLGGEAFVNSDRDDTGMGVVRWIVANKPKIDKIVVHSLNHPAATEMSAKLDDAGYDVEVIPFTSLWQEIDRLIS